MRNGSNYVSANPLQAHFGLGQLTRASRLTVSWPYGNVSTLLGVKANQFLEISDDLIALGGFE